MMTGDALDWFGKLDLNPEAPMDYTKFERELLATGTNMSTQVHGLQLMLKTRQGNRPIQQYIDKFCKYKNDISLEDEMSAVLFRNGANYELKDLLKYHPITMPFN